MQDIYLVLSKIVVALDRIADTLDLISFNSISPSSSSSASVPAGVETISFHASSIVVTTDDNGKCVYRAKGDRFMKYGIRIWDEVFPIIGIDPLSLSLGHNPVSMTLLCAFSSDGLAKKVIGLAPSLSS